MSLLSLDYVASLPDAEPRKKTLLARAYGALYRARMARVETLLEQYRPLLDELDREAKTHRTNAFTIGD
jgi:hypothetical protein